MWRFIKNKKKSIQTVKEIVNEIQTQHDTIYQKRQIYDKLIAGILDEIISLCPAYRKFEKDGLYYIYNSKTQLGCKVRNYFGHVRLSAYKEFKTEVCLGKMENDNFIYMEASCTFSDCNEQINKIDLVRYICRYLIG